MKEGSIRKIEIHSDEIQEIISEVPGWINRWGITLIFALFTVLLLLCWFIKYPDIINATVVVTTSPPPLTLPSRTSGNITLLKKENSKVQTGDLIAYIKSNANPFDVLALKKAVQEKSPELYKSPSWNLGEIQPYFTDFLNATNELHRFQQIDIHSKQIKQLLQQENAYKKLSSTLSAQFSITQEELALAHEKFKRDSLLFRQQVNSAQDYNAAQALYLQQKHTYKNSESSITVNEIQISVLQKQIVELEAQKTDQNNKLILNAENTRNELMARIAKWEETYLFITPIEGTIAYLKFLDNNIYTEPGKELFTIIPDTRKMYAQAEIPIAGSGKVQKGQAVNIRLANFPTEQFGMLRGIVTEISEIPSDKKYLAKIELPTGLLTTYNKDLPFKNQLHGETEIITEDLRIIDRIFYQFRYLLRDRQ